MHPLILHPIPEPVQPDHPQATWLTVIETLPIPPFAPTRKHTLADDFKNV